MSVNLILSESGKRTHYSPPKKLSNDVIDILSEYKDSDTPVRMPKEEVGEFLKRLRNSESMTGEQLSKKLDCKVGFIWKFENGSKSIPHKKKMLIAKIFNIEFTELDEL